MLEFCAKQVEKLLSSVKKSQQTIPNMELLKFW